MEHQVEYSGGQSINGTGAVDYMMVTINGIELYAEIEPATDDETITYDYLKSEIILQAKHYGTKYGINVKDLQFHFGKD